MITIKKSLQALILSMCSLGCSVPPEQARREEMFKRGEGLPPWIQKPVHSLDYKKLCEKRLYESICLRGEYHPLDNFFIPKEYQKELLILYSWEKEEIVAKR